jgi:hypothetical protein
MLGAYGVGNLVSSTSLRCVNTLVPYAKSRAIAVDEHSLLSEEEGTDDARGVARLINKVAQAASADCRPTAICVHRPVLPAILDALDLPPVTLVTGEFLVAHLTRDGGVHAVERHRPQA